MRDHIHLVDTYHMDPLKPNGLKMHRIGSPLSCTPSWTICLTSTSFNYLQSDLSEKESCFALLFLLDKPKMRYKILMC